MITTEQNSNLTNQFMLEPNMNDSNSILKIGIELDANTLSVKSNQFENILKNIKENNQQYTSIYVGKNISEEMLESLKESLKLNTIIGYIDWGINTNSPLIQEINAIVKSNACVHQYYANDLEHALMSLHVYKEGKTNDIPSITQTDFNQNEIQEELLDSYNQILSNWQIEQVFDFSGGYAALYKNGQKAILVYRGLSFKFIQLIQQNSSTKGAIEGGIRNQIISQHEEVYKIMNKLSKSYQQRYLSITGYGFGGWLAEISIFLAIKELNYDARKLKCVSFESFGSKDVLDKFQSNIQNKYTKFDPSDLDVTIYLSIPNPLNSMNKHIGTVYSIATTSKSKVVNGTATICDKIKELKSYIGKIYRIDSNYIEGRILGLSSVFAVNMVNILQAFDLKSGFVRSENIGMVKDWPHINFQPPKQGICAQIYIAFSKCLPCGEKLAKVAASGLSKAIDLLVGESKISNIITLVKDLILGDTDSSQYWKVFENMEIKNGKYQVKEDADRFGMKFEGHYDVVEFFINEDILSKQNQRGDIEWYLCRLQKNSKLIAESNSIAPHQKLILKDIIISYEIDEQCKKIKLLPRSDFKTVKNLKDYLTRLLNINPVLKDISDGQVIVENIQQEVNENKMKIELINQKVQNIVSIDDLSMNIPIPRDKNILEKEDVYKQIDYLLEKEQVVVLKGFGGLGKSTCAAMYGRNKDKEGQKVIWFYAEDGIDNDYECLCNKINLDVYGKDAAYKREQIEIRLKKSQNKFLFIFDNVNKLEDIESYIINMPTNVKVIVTTRQDIGQYSTIDLNEFTQNEAITYLNNVLQGKKYSEEELQNLIQTVGKLPLRLALAGSYLTVNKLTTIPKYINKYDELSQKINIKLHTGKSDKAQAITSILSLETLSNNELMMMIYASYLNADFIQLDIFKGLGFSEDNIEEIIQKLSELSLLKYLDQEEAFRIHRLVQSETRLFMQSKQQQKNNEQHYDDNINQENIFGKIAIVLNKLFPYLNQQYNQELWKRANQYIYHVESFLSFTNEQLDVNIAKLFDKQGLHSVYILCKLDSGIDQQRKGIDILNKLYGNSNHQDLAISLNNLGLTYNYKSDYDKSIEYLKQSLDIYKQIFGEDDPQVATTLRNIGFTYLDKMDYDESIMHLKQCLAIRKKVFGQVHADVGAALNNIGIIYQNKGDYVKSIKYLNRGLDIRKQALGENHIDVAATLNNLGNTYKLQEEYDKAINHLNQSLIIAKQALGEFHSQVAITITNLGVSYLNKGDYEKSIEYFNQSLAIRKKVFGENHDEFGQSLNNLGDAYKQKGDYDKAIEYYKQSLAIKKQIFGENHVEVDYPLFNLGYAYKQKGDYDKAIEYFQQSLVIRKQLLGENHTLVKNILDLLSSFNIKKSEQEINYLNQSFEKRIQVENNDEVASRLESSSLTYQIKGDQNNSVEYLNQSLAIRKLELGEKQTYATDDY
ncbi:hypothetical protein ABPG74_014982 [Tetrahymena malaccensis]